MTQISKFLIKAIDGMLYLFIGPFAVLYIIPHFLTDRFPPQEHGFGLPGLYTTGIVLMVSGALLALWCTWQMLWRGKGTPLVATPPSEILNQGIYKYIRNPMMWSLILVLLGEVVHHGSWVLALWLAAWARIGHLFLVMYEEPQLHQRFGESYAAYCRNVPRWLPRIRKSA